MNIKEILKDYEEEVSMSVELRLWATKQNYKLKKGDIFDIPTATVPITVILINNNSGFANVALMSYQWELATEYDVFVKIDHPIRGAWIIQMDSIITIPTETLQRSRRVGRANSEDIKLLDKSINDIPYTKRGCASFLEENRRFKEIEAEKAKALFKETLKQLIN